MSSIVFEKKKCAKRNFFLTFLRDINNTNKISPSLNSGDGGSLTSRYLETSVKIYLHGYILLKTGEKESICDFR